MPLDVQRSPISSQPCGLALSAIRQSSVSCPLMPAIVGHSEASVHRTSGYMIALMLVRVCAKSPNA